MPKPKPAAKKIINYLEKHRIKFEVLDHKKVYTAYDLAQTVGAKLEEIAKTLLIKVQLPEIKKSGKYFVVVVPASYYVDLEKVKKALKATKVELASEKLFSKLDIEPGAVSPFGSLREFGVLVDRGLLEARHALVGAESFVQSLKLKVKDLVELEQAIVANVGKKNKLKMQNHKQKKASKMKKQVKLFKKSKVSKKK
jgi:prolyl-tRNA editing enzyme YbaK/EbsC (Cys-tRNA(Pro) deacylase)